MLTFPRPTCDIGTSGAGEIFLVTRLCKRWLGLIKLLVLLDVTLVLSNDAAAQDSLYDDGVLSSIAKLDGDEIPLYLEVYVNGRSTELIAEFGFDPVNGSMSSRRSELIEVGVDLSFGLNADVSLSNISGLTYVYDDVRQIIKLTLDPEIRLEQIVSAHKSPMQITADPAWGAVINYGASVDVSERANGKPEFNRFSLSTNAWLFSPFGVVSNTATYTYLPDGTKELLREQSRYDFSLPSRALTVSIGDIITSGLAWSHPIRIGGAQVRREFGLRSDIVREPLLSFKGAAAVPSSIDVFIDNNRVYSGELNEGPYRFEDIPIYAGAGNAVVVIQSETGEVETREVPFFASQNLLKRGVADWSIEAGYARESFGIQRNQYGKNFLYSGSLCFGVTNRLTIEGHVEGSDEMQLWGGGVSAVILNTVELNFSAGQSNFKSETASFAYGSMRTSLLGVAVETSSLRSEDGFTDLAYQTGIDAVGASSSLMSLLEFPSSLDVISLTLPVDQAGLGVSYIRSSHGSLTDEIISMNYTRGIEWHDASFNLSGTYDLQTNNMQISTLLTVPFGNASVQLATRQSSLNGKAGSLSYYQPLGTGIGDVGYSASFDYGDRRRSIAAALQTRTNYGTGRLSAQLASGDFALQARFDGAIVTTAGRVALGNKVNDAFAIVDVGIPDVPVYLQNRKVALTSSRGQALVPGLGSFVNNRLSINPNDLPLDVTFRATGADVVPSLRSGVVVDFGGVSTDTSAILTLRLANGSLVQPGSVARLAATREEFIVGYDGQIYVTNLSLFNELNVTTFPGTCTALFDGPLKTELQNNLGEIVCQ